MVKHLVEKEESIPRQRPFDHSGVAIGWAESKGPQVKGPPSSGQNLKKIIFPLQ